MSKLVVVTGVPCSGKSTFIKELVKLTGNKYFYLNQDDIKQAFWGDKSRLCNEYILNIRPKVLQATRNIIERNIDAGNSVILEATFWYLLKDPEWYTKLAHILLDVSRIEDVKFVRCIAREEIIKERMEIRGYKRDRDKLVSLEIWKEWLEKEPIYLKYPYGYEVNTDPIDCMCSLMEYINEQ